MQLSQQSKVVVLEASRANQKYNLQTVLEMGWGKK